MNNKTIISFGLYLFLISFIPIVILFLIEISVVIKIIISFLWLFMLSFYFYFTILDKRIIIGSEGIAFCSYKVKKMLKWTNIKEIGVVEYAPFPVAHSARFICFSKDLGSTGRRILKFEENYIYVKYQEAIITEILRYWDNEIIGLNDSDN
ncbi:hypothetical protein [Paenibacillus sp. SYP-B4298]|uniref:hypothetical protein n=1 Tax=Paenibacillus sp. SYP-B4298 TaxID=2996034 RepID=UPI0022DD0860|nr:hypothetical protein [Paenibacillus sp. SYP-B4298]